MLLVGKKQRTLDGTGFCAVLCWAVLRCLVAGVAIKFNFQLKQQSQLENIIISPSQDDGQHCNAFAVCVAFAAYNDGSSSNSAATATSTATITLNISPFERKLA